MLSKISLKDKLVQHAFKRILQICLEGIICKKINTISKVQIQKVGQNPQGISLLVQKNEKPIIPTFFSKHSHGFHFNESCHTALAAIKKSWKNINYFLNIDIKKTFNTLTIQRLFNIIKKLFEDQRIIEELQKMVKAQLILFNDYTVNSKTASTNSLICLLFNLYMTKFDYFIEKLINLDNKNIIQIAKPLRKINGYKFLKKTKKLIKSKTLVFFKKKQKISFTSNITASNCCSIRKQVVCVYYIRYLDTLLFGIKGSKLLSRRIQHKVVYFLNKELHFACIKIELRSA